MSFDHCLYPVVPDLQQAAQRAWAIKRLHDERAMDRLAALQSFDTLCALNPNPRLRRLCETITYRLFPEVARPQRAPSEARTGGSAL